MLTCCPGETPDLIWVRTAPTVPTVTRTAFVVDPSTTVTRWVVPSVRTAEVGTVVPDALLVTIETPASPPEKSPRLDDSRSTVTGYVVDVELLVASTPIPVTVPGTAVPEESGVTSACWPRATWSILATGPVVTTWYEEPEPRMTI